MNQQKRTKPTVSRRRRIESYYIVFLAAVALGLYFAVFYGQQASTDFVVSFTAGILGIMAGLSLERIREQAKDNQIKEDFLALMRNELKEIRDKIPPQKKIPLVLSTLTRTPLMLYPEVWDSFVSSGLMRLLNAEQVTKLSSVYRFVKATQYEAEWIRRVTEEFESLPEQMKAEREILNRRYKFLQESYDRRGEQLTKDIDQILKETWFGNNQT